MNSKNERFKVKSKQGMLNLLVAVLLALAGLGLDAVLGKGALARTDLVVFAAASTTNAVTEIGQLYDALDAAHIIPSFASSSTLAKQIESGAPADVYLSADEKWMDYLAGKNLIVKGSRFDLLGNRIVLIAPVQSQLQRIDVVPGFSLVAALGREGRLSLGDPGHVPAGIYGKKALENLGAWDAIKDRLAPMNDVRAALVLVERGEAPLGLVYATDAAISSKVRVVGTFPAASHPPIVYPVAAVAGAKMLEARRFMDFLKSAQARAVFQKFGFEVR
jgi:molybdate transport system substrate-binding protein